MRTMELESMAVEMPEVVGHPNRLEFRGVLATVDVASRRAPSGAKGHLVVLTRAAAERALPSLLGMALDYAPSLDRHDVRRKIGVITRAEIVGRDLEVGGYLYARDFPEIVEEIGRSARSGRRLDRKSNIRTLAAKGAARTGDPANAGLGMSYEVTDVHLDDVRARVWILSKITFTGAAVLRRDKAAYADTWIELVPST